MMDTERKDIVSLREYLESMITGLRIEAEIRTKHMDEKFVTLDKVEDIVRRDIKSLELTRAHLEGKATQTSVNITFILALVSLFMAIMNFIK